MLFSDTLELDGPVTQPGHLLAGVSHSLPRILLVDDQPEVRERLATLLEGEFEIVGTAEDGQQALELISDRSPDVVVLDISMPVLNGIETARSLQSSQSQAKVVFVTVYEDVEFLEAAISVGALGYVLKTHMATDLVRAIRAALEDSFFVSPSINYQLPESWHP